MKRYTVCKRPLFLKAGNLELTELQARRRVKDLFPCTKKGEYKIVGEVCFKVGEKIGIDTKTARGVKKTGVIE